MSDATRGLYASITRRLLAFDEPRLRAIDDATLAIEQLDDADPARLQISIARDRLYFAADELRGDELERAALAYAAAVRDQRRGKLAADRSAV